MIVSNKKTFKHAGIVILLFFLALFVNQFLIWEWRVQYSEKRIQRNIKTNYELNKETFSELNTFLQSMDSRAISRIDFLPRNQFEIDIKNHSIPDSIENHINFNPTPLYRDTENMVNFDLLANGNARIHLEDTMVEVKKWYWNFEGDEKHSDFEKLLSYANLSTQQLDSLCTLVQKIDCEGVSFYNDQSISIKYDGIELYKYEYLILNKDALLPENYEYLDDQIYYGLNDSDLFCGQFIFSK